MDNWVWLIVVLGRVESDDREAYRKVHKGPSIDPAHVSASLRRSAKIKHQSNTSQRIIPTLNVTTACSDSAQLGKI
ncbi:hypothetical protein CPC08DRAFT_711750, partial [Agrocybe pediades]